MSYIRLSNNEIVEVFPYNPFDWIPNQEFLKSCIYTDQEVECGMYYNDITGQFEHKPIEPPKEPEPTMEELQLEFNIDMEYRVSLMEMGLI